MKHSTSASQLLPAVACCQHFAVVQALIMVLYVTTWHHATAGGHQLNSNIFKCPNFECRRFQNLVTFMKIVINSYHISLVSIGFPWSHDVNITPDWCPSKRNQVPSRIAPDGFSNSCHIMSYPLVIP